LDHFQYECPRWEEKANYVELEEEGEILLMSFVEPNQYDKEVKEKVWFLDSGATITCVQISSGSLILMRSFDNL